MKTRKILFDIIVADGFVVKDKWPQATGNHESIRVPIEFDWNEKEDVMKAAERALDEFVKSSYPRKDYRIYYWWWMDIEGWDNDIAFIV